MNPQIATRIYIIRSRIILLKKQELILFSLLFFNVLKTGKAPGWQVKVKKTVATPVKKLSSLSKPLLISNQFA